MGNSESRTTLTINNVTVNVGKLESISVSARSLDTGHTTNKVVEMPLECSTDAFFKFFKEDANKFHRITSNKSSVDAADYKWLFLHPTETWEHINYEVGGIDNDSKKITYKVVQGEVLQFYHTFTVTLEVTAGSTAKWTIEYEKKIASNPDPDVSLEILREITIAANAYIATPAEA